jgi:hypothetical protein
MFKSGFKEQRSPLDTGQRGFKATNDSLTVCAIFDRSTLTVSLVPPLKHHQK